MTIANSGASLWVYETPLFSGEWYFLAVSKNLKGKHPAEHFAEHGMTNLADPHPLFHSRWYQQQHPEIIEDNWVPLHHYLFYGWKRYFRPNPFFDVERYCSKYAPMGEPLTDYITNGWRNGRNPNASFDGAWYMQAYNPPTHISPLEHYVRNRTTRSLEPSPLFDTEWYGLTYPEALEDPYLHFVLQGEKAGVQTTPILGKGMWEPREFDAMKQRLDEFSGYVRKQALTHV